MSQTLVKNYVHIVFSTKNRTPILDSSIREEVFKYIGGICKSQDCFPVIVGGYIDHIHILCVLSKNRSLAKLMEVVKSNSSKWIKTKGIKYKKFAWQEGYGAFSIHYNKLQVVVKYIENQETHHKKKQFKEEFEKFMQSSDIEFDPKYLWN
jgi:REP element-mobilizing transposase RayT